LSFAEERIGPLAAIVTTVFYLLTLYLLILPNTPENLFASIYCESLIKTTHQHLLLLVGFDTLIYQKYYDIPPILVGHHSPFLSVDEQGNIIPKTPEAALVAAQAYLLTTRPNPGDPRKHMHRAALNGLNMVGHKLSAKGEEVYHHKEAHKPRSHHHHNNPRHRSSNQ
jgi:hypothetical protein